MSSLALVGWGAAALLVVLWRVIPVRAPGARRAPLEWFAAASLYGVLLAIFTNLVRRSWANDSTLGLVAFGFLWIVFAGGLCVVLWNGARSLRPSAKGEVDATH